MSSGPATPYDCKGVYQHGVCEAVRGVPAWGVYEGEGRGPYTPFTPPYTWPVIHEGAASTSTPLTNTP